MIHAICFQHTDYAQVVAEALRLAGAEVHSTPVHTLVMSFDVLK